MGGVPRDIGHTGALASVAVSGATGVARNSRHLLVRLNPSKEDPKNPTGSANINTSPEPHPSSGSTTSATIMVVDTPMMMSTIGIVEPVVQSAVAGTGAPARICGGPSTNRSEQPDDKTATKARSGSRFMFFLRLWGVGRGTRAV